MSDGLLVATQAVAQLVISPEDTPPSLVVVSEQVAVLVAVGQQGPRGAPGNASGLSLVQSSPSILWAITHNLGRYPVVVCVDTSREVIFGDVASAQAASASGTVDPATGAALPGQVPTSV